MIKMKESHLARAEWASCCGNVCNLASQIDSEIKSLQDTLDVIKEGNDSKAASLLEDYVTFLQKSYEPEHPNCW
jgi:hypothetical protein